MKNGLFEKIRKAVKSAKTALIVAHIDPDGDTIGSAIASAMLLDQLGLTVTIYSADGVPAIYRFLPWANRIKHELPLGAHFDLAVAVDASDLDRIGNKINLRESAALIINIDHHPDNSQYGDINYVEKISSVAEQIYKLCKYFKVKLNREMAENIYTAMITDTGNFRYENTSVSTFLVAAELLKAGVKTHEITTRIYDTKSLASLKILAKALAQLDFSAEGKVAWSAISHAMMMDTGARGEDLIGLVDLIRSIDGVEVAILFREDKDKIKINFRAKHKVNVGEIATRFGGGGHAKAAGAIVAGNLSEVKNRVVMEAVKYIEALKYLV